MPIRRRLLRELAIVAALLVPLVAALYWFGLVRVLNQRALARAQESLQKLDQQITGRLQAIQREGNIIASLFREGALDPERVDEDRRQILPVMRALPSIAEVLLVRASDGVTFGELREADFQTKSIRPQGDGTSLIYTTRHDRAGLRLDPVQVTREAYHPLSRPWVLHAERSGAASWTEAYLFAPAPLGITYAVPVRGRDGKIMGFVGIDLLLDDLATLADDVRPTPSSLVVVLDEKDRILAPPLAVGAEARKALVLEKPSSEKLPLLHALLESGAQASEIRILRHEGQTYLSRLFPISGLARQRWRVGLVIPESELVGPIRSHMALLFLALLALFLVASWRVVVITRELAGSLARLAGGAEALGKGAALDLPNSPLQEIQSVSEALGRAQVALAEYARLQEQLMHSQRVALVGMLAGGIAHDVNNQITAVLGEVSACRLLLPPDHEGQTSLKLAERSCLRCAQVTGKLLNFSRGSPPSFRTVDLNALVLETIHVLRRVLGRSITIEQDLEEGLPPVMADPAQIEHVIVNLGVNARDAMEAGGVLRFSTGRGADAEVRLSVQDTGAGMTPEVRERIFDPFFTTKEPDKGTGLGLFMVQTIVCSHGGRIEVQSEPGQGTTFTIHLPAAQQPARIRAASIATASAPPRRLGGKRVLVVDDEDVVRNLEAQVLRSAGAHVEVARDGEEAFRLWQSSTPRFDAVVCDNGMPRCGGRELVQRLRSNGSVVPIVLATGGGEALGHQDHGVVVVFKPFQPDELVQKLERLLAATSS